MTFFVKMFFRSNGVRLNDDSANDFSIKRRSVMVMAFSHGVRSNGVQKISVKSFFGKMSQNL
jgi:hypothetical protein